ncbi:MAG TPA: hypothetical protein VFO16_16940 [Pseudonocardiaceae bacterium]|nr:hypothetical protein [Pseudonocardiaceae bacterium]
MPALIVMALAVMALAVMALAVMALAPGESAEPELVLVVSSRFPPL